MIAADFENDILARGHYIASPSLFSPGVDKDAEFYTGDQFIDIMNHDDDGLVRLVRKRSEQTGNTTYYFKDEAKSEYFKVTCPNSVGAPTTLQKIQNFFHL